MVVNADALHGVHLQPRLEWLRFELRGRLRILPDLLADHGVPRGDLLSGKCFHRHILTQNLGFCTERSVTNLEAVTILGQRSTLIMAQLTNKPLLMFQYR